MENVTLPNCKVKTHTKKEHVDRLLYCDINNKLLQPDYYYKQTVNIYQMWREQWKTNIWIDGS